MNHTSKARLYKAGIVGYSSGYINLGAVNRVCKECAVSIVAGLDALGLIGKPKEEVDKFMAVMD